jgi:hypothetical protein
MRKTLRDNGLTHPDPCQKHHNMPLEARIVAQKARAINLNVASLSRLCDYV